MRVGVSYMFHGISGRFFNTRMNSTPQVRYSFADLPTFLRGSCATTSRPHRIARCTARMAELPLIRRSLIEHEALIARRECRSCCGGALDQAV